MNKKLLKKSKGIFGFPRHSSSEAEEDSPLSRSTLGTEPTETTLASTFFQPLPLSEDKWYRLTPEQMTLTATSTQESYQTAQSEQQSNQENRLCYNSFTYFSPLIFLIYSLHAPTSCLLFLVYVLISFYRLSFLSCAALLFMHSLMHSTITHAQSAY